MGTSWRHFVMTVLLGDVAARANTQQPASAPAANHTPVSSAVQMVQPFSDIVSENVFDLQKRDLIKGVQGQAVRCATQPGNNAPAWHEMSSDQVHYASIPGLEAGVLIQRTGQK